MTTTKEESLARQFDRFNTDVNVVFKRFRLDVPNLQKTKLHDKELGATSYIFWYEEDGSKIYIS